MELGLYTFAEVMPDPRTGQMMSPAQRLRNLMEEIELADQVGLDVFGIGEHHRPEYAVSAPAVVLAAAAMRTKRIRLSSAVTVLSSDDPVRVFQDFATVDLLSDGRAEIMAGRGSFIESFPLFGYDLTDYDDLFAEKLDLLLRLRADERLTWQGRHRPAIDDLGVYPRPVQSMLPVWVAVGGSPGSAVRAGTLGLPMAVAIIGGQPERFAPLIEMHRRAGRQAGRASALLRVSINSHGFIADTAQQAVDAFYPSYALTMSRLGRERGWGPMTRRDFDALRGLHGSMVLGTSDEVIEKILFQQSILGHHRFMLQPTVGAVPHDQVLHAIELFGTVVAPAVRRALSGKEQPAAPVQLAR